MCWDGYCVEWGRTSRRAIGYRPWLVETFVEPEHDGSVLPGGELRVRRPHRGAGTLRPRPCRRPARRSRSTSTSSTPHWRRTLGPRTGRGGGVTLGPGEGLDSAQWAANEFGDAPLGDKRLSARLVQKRGALLASCPGHAFTGAPDRAAVKGYYRLIDHPDESQVTPEHIVAPHRARTIERMRAHDTVLCIQDGTDLNFATRPGCEGLEHHRTQPDLGEDVGPAPASDARGERGRAAARGAALRVRCASARR